MGQVTRSSEQERDLAAFRHVDIVMALCRSAAGLKSSVVDHQIERLRDALKADGDTEAAARLTRMLQTEEHALEMTSSKLKRSSAGLSSGELLSRNTALPVDRETASPLAEIVFTDTLPTLAPVFEPMQQAAIDSLIEEWKFSDALAAQGVPAPRTCLLYGAPGTGKTALALWMARQLALPVVLVRLDGLISSFLGTTSRNIGSLFAFACRYKCVLLLDEFDAIAKLRDDPQEVGEIKRVVNTLLQNLDQRASIGLTIAITNHEGLLDPAVWRRFETQIAVPRPGLLQRQMIVERYMVPYPISPAKTRFLAWMTDGLSGAEIEQVARSIKRSLTVRAQDVGTSYGFIDAVRNYASLNNGRLRSDIAHSIMSKSEDLAVDLRRDPHNRFRNADLTDILDAPKTTITRWTSKSPTLEVASTAS